MNGRLNSTAARRANKQSTFRGSNSVFNRTPARSQKAAARTSGS